MAEAKAATSGNEPWPADLKVALVHDWLTGMRGGEKVLADLCQLFPGADLFTLLHVPGSVDPIIESRWIQTSFLQRLPAAARIYRWALPLFPAAIESLNLSNYDLVLSSSHCVAKSARASAEALTVCYCHTPMRYIWANFADYFGDKTPPLRWAIGRVAAGLRRWDRRTARRVRLWLANSRLVRQRILDYYGVAAADVSIVPPPVDTEIFARAADLEPPPGLASYGYDLVVSALVPYKRVDLAISAAKQRGRHLVVVGKGPEGPRLQRLAAETRGPGQVSFAGAVPTSELPGYYAHCRAFLFPALEDFGITPLEATACGRPVVAYQAGGALDTVVEGLNGIFFPAQTTEALGEALADPRLDGPWDTESMAAHAMKFGRERFRHEVKTQLARAWQRHAGGTSRV
jgi:glycosyltransferase involved in cell wall biosynthesis